MASFSECLVPVCLLYTSEEKNFVVQFAFRSGSKEDTICLIEALGHSADKAESDEIMVTYLSLIHICFHRQATMQIRFFILELVHLHLLQVLE